MAAIAACGLVATDRALAAEPHIVGMQVISSDATARFLPLLLDKSVVMELPVDIGGVLVGAPDIAGVVVRSKRRVYIIGKKVGNTDVHFFDASGRQIGSLDIAVTKYPLPPEPRVPAKWITVVAGVDENSNARIQLLKCAPICTGAPLHPAEQPTRQINSTSTSTNTNTNTNTGP
jgi:hypothetical protein